MDVFGYGWTLAHCAWLLKRAPTDKVRIALDGPLLFGGLRPVQVEAPRARRSSHAWLGHLACNALKLLLHGGGWLRLFESLHVRSLAVWAYDRILIL